MNVRAERAERAESLDESCDRRTEELDSYVWQRREESGWDASRFRYMT